MRKIAAKWVPYAVTEQQKWCRYESCHIHLEKYQNEGEKLLNNIITIDETWVRAYEHELKRQSAEWRHEKSPRRQKFRQNPSPIKLMVILVYDVQGVILCLLCHMVKLLMHSTMLHICKITYVEQLGVNGHNCKMRSFCIIMLFHIRRFVSGIYYDARASTILTGPFAL